MILIDALMVVLLAACIGAGVAVIVNVLLGE